MGFILSLLVLALMVAALIDIVRRDDSEVKHLPKIFWVLFVALIPLLGGIAWFAFGRDWKDGGLRIPRMRERAPRAPHPQAPPATPADTRSTEQQIADLDREIEEWRLRAELEKRRREQGDTAPE